MWSYEYWTEGEKSLPSACWLHPWDTAEDAAVRDSAVFPCRLFSLLPPRTPRFVSTDLFSRQPVPSLYHSKELLCPRGKTWQNFMRFPSACFSSLGKSFRLAASSISIAPDSLVSATGLLGTQCPPLICEAIRRFVGEDQMIQEKSTLGKSLLTVPNHLLHEVEADSRSICSITFSGGRCSCLAQG